MKIFIPFLFLLTLYSCTQDPLLNQKRRLSQDWEFTRVVARKNWTLRTTNITNDYQNYRLGLYEDGFLEFIDDANGIIYEGSWTLSKVSGLDDDCTHIMAWSYSDSTGSVMLHSWEVNFTNQRIWAYEQTPTDHLRLRLRSL